MYFGLHFLFVCSTIICLSTNYYVINLVMKLLLLEELTQQGISSSDIKKSLTLNYVGKTFCRQSDLPKKFRAKAFNLCLEMIQQGKESFIIDTSYSYTIWVEQKNIDEVIESKDSKFIIKEIQEYADEKVNNLPLSSVNKNSIKIEEKIPFIHQNEIDNQTKILQEEYNIFHSPKGENFTQNRKENISYVSETIDDTKKYRGVRMNQPMNKKTVVEEETLSTHRLKTRTYRGITY